jgi:plasmid stability protein
VANVTLAVDDDVLRRARIRALEQGTSVNALVRDYLESFAGKAPANEGLATFLELADRVSAGSGEGGRSWTRDDAHAR